MTFSLKVILQVVNAQGEVVDSRGNAVVGSDQIGALSSETTIQQFDTVEASRDRLNHMWSINRELSSAFNNRPPRS